eukprot:1064376-Rhodomonas_salina.2
MVRATGLEPRRAVRAAHCWIAQRTDAPRSKPRDRQAVGLVRYKFSDNPPLASIASTCSLSVSKSTSLAGRMVGWRRGRLRLKARGEHTEGAR